MAARGAVEHRSYVCDGEVEDITDGAYLGPVGVFQRIPLKRLGGRSML